MKVVSSGKRGQRRGATPMAEINIIPLVDVTLVLLIIFMATTAFVKESGLNMKLPAAASSEVTPQENKDINVSLTRDNKIYLDGKQTDEKTVQAVFVQRARKNKDVRVIIKGDGGIAYQRVVSVIDLAKKAGLPRVALATQLLEDAKTQTAPAVGASAPSATAVPAPSATATR